MTEQPPIDAIVREACRLGRVEVDALVAELRAGGEAAWNAPSYCADWQARDVVAHVIVAVSILGGAVRATLSGQPPPGFDPAQAQARAAQLLARPRADVLADLERVYSEHADYLETLDVAALAFPVSLPFGTFPVWVIATVVLNEIALHRWDVQAGVDGEAHLAEETVPALVAVAIQGVPILAHGEKRDGTWQLDVAAPTGGQLTLRVRSDQVHLEPGPAADAVARVALDGEAFVLLLWGRLDLARAIEGGRVQVQGDREQALALQRLFPGA